MAKALPKGIHPKGHKELTKDKPIVLMPPPTRVYLAIAARGEPNVHVSVGDEVEKGALVATGTANVFSSCSGKVVDILKRPSANGSFVTHIVIENDGKNKTTMLKPLTNPTSEEIIERVTYSGITGMGGAGFPTGEKLKQKKKIEYFLINGAECEPYITCDNRIMIEHAKECVDGAVLLRDAVGARVVIFGVEDNKPEAIAALREAASGVQNVEIVELKTKFPQGDSRRLIYSVLGIKISQIKRTTDSGVMVNNVHTAFAVYQAVRMGITSYSRVITVTGGGIANPGNYLVANGTLLSDLIEFCGGLNNQNTVKIISGGPMMGEALLNTDYSTDNNTGSILLLTNKETEYVPSSPCINCAKCAKVCPANIMPMYIDLYTKEGDFEMAKKYGAEYCIECGCCSYICPAKRSLAVTTKKAKHELLKRKREAKK